MASIGRWLERAGREMGGVRVRVDEVAGGIERFRISSRVTRLFGMEAAAYLAGPLLVDSAFALAGEALDRALAGRRLAAICLTHHHEDHAGLCGRLAAAHRCPVYLRDAGARFGEGLADLAPYRRIGWGTPYPYEPLEMSPTVEAGGRTLRAVPIPGHSATHTALVDETSGAVFAGDLFVSPGATAVMSHENPLASIASLRRVADLEPRWLLGGHVGPIENPGPLLRRKAEAIEGAAERVWALHERGTSEAEIVRRVFPGGRAHDLLLDVLSGGEFSRTRFVRACIRHGRGA